MGERIGHGPACAFCSSARGPASCPARPPARPRINSEDHAGDKYTPTTEDVRLVYGSDSTGMLRGDLVAAFDRYLAAHDREVRVATLREAADRIETFDGNDFLRALVGINGGATALLEYVLTTLREEPEGGAS